MKLDSVKPTQNYDFIVSNGQTGQMPIWQWDRVMPSSSCGSSSSQSGTEARCNEWGLVKLIRKLELKLELRVEVIKVSDILVSWEPVDVFISSLLLICESYITFLSLYKMLIRRMQFTHILNANSKQASRLPWRAYSQIYYALLADVGGQALPTVFGPLRVYRPKSQITDFPKAQGLRGIPQFQ